MTDDAKQMPFTLASATIRQMRAEGYLVPNLDDRLLNYGFGGKCGGVTAAQGWETIPDGERVALFTEWARRLDVPNAERAGAAVAALFRLGLPRGPVPDVAAIAREWDGAIHAAHLTDVLPRMETLSDAERERLAFFRQAGWLAAFTRTNDEKTAWVAERFVLLEMLGVEKNPFAPYLGLST